MRKFKRTFAVALALAMSVSMFSGCGDKKNGGTISDATATDAQSDSTEETTLATDNMDLDKYISYYAENVTLGDYKNIEYSYEVAVVSDSDIQSSVDSFLSENATYDEDKESEAKTGDTVNIDFTGKIDGVEFDGGSGTNYDLVLGSGSFIDDFEDQIVGHKAGDTFDVAVTFPDDYGNDDLNGKDAVFTTTLNYIKITHTPELTDELVAENTDFSNVADYKQDLKNNLYNSNKENALAAVQNKVMTTAIDNSTIENIPEDEVAQTANDIIAKLKQTASSYNIEFTDYINYAYGYDDEEKFNEYVTTVCQETVKEKMVVCAVAKAENITVTDADVDAYVNKMAEDYSTDASTVKSTYKEADLRYYTLAEKVMNFLIENGKNTSNDINPLDDETEAPAVDETTEADTAEDAASTEETETTTEE